LGVIFVPKLIAQHMSLFNNISKKVEEGILYLTINRPDKLNALNIATLKELKEVMQQAYDDDEVRGILITGAGPKAFVAGADISELKDLNEVNGRKFSEEGQEVFDLIENSHKPVIAVVNGYALGGGCEIAMACHMRVASVNARFGLPEVSLGIIPGYGGTQRLTQLVGKGLAFEMMMTGDMIDAEKAQQIGLVNHVVEDQESAMQKAEDIMKRIFERAPLAVAMVVDCVNAVFSEENGYLLEANSFANCCKSKDFEEGTSAFLEKRKPDFQGE
jgi:enoyl-CoA hydratase